MPEEKEWETWGNEGRERDEWGFIYREVWAVSFDSVSLFLSQFLCSVLGLMCCAFYYQPWPTLPALFAAFFEVSISSLHQLPTIGVGMWVPFHQPIGSNFSTIAYSTCPTTTPTPAPNGRLWFNWMYPMSASCIFLYLFESSQIFVATSLMSDWDLILVMHAQYPIMNLLQSIAW